MYIPPTMAVEKPEAALEDRRKKLCQPEAGSFNYFCAALKWEKGKNKGKEFDYCYIPTDRRKDFEVGEGIRGRCHFYKERVKQKKDDTAFDAEALDCNNENENLEKVPNKKVYAPFLPKKLLDAPRMDSTYTLP
jgi:hypothetical protein